MPWTLGQAARSPHTLKGMQVRSRHSMRTAVLHHSKSNSEIYLRPYAAKIRAQVLAWNWYTPLKIGLGANLSGQMPEKIIRHFFDWFLRQKA